MVCISQAWSILSAKPMKQPMSVDLAGFLVISDQTEVLGGALVPTQPKITKYTAQATPNVY